MNKAPTKKTKLAAAAAIVVPPVVPLVPPGPLKIDLGSGKMKAPGFLGVDALSLPGVDIVCNLGVDTWPWANESVDEARASHFLEHLTNLDGRFERCHFFNELYRVLKLGAGCWIAIPHWCSNRYYGDPTHKEPFSEMGFSYLNRAWRVDQAPHTDAGITGDPRLYDCDFDLTYGYGLHPGIQPKNQEQQQYALTFYKEAATDLIATVAKNRAPPALPGPNG